MPIGNLVPGVPTTVTPDTTPSYYSSFDGPAPDDEIIVDDLLSVIQLALNVQQIAIGGSYSSISAMATGETHANLGDRAYVMGCGWYYYDTTTITEELPWIVTATGVGSGVWISEFLSIFESATPRKLKSELMPFTTLVNANGSPLTSAINFTSPDLTTEWTDLKAGDGSNIGITLSASGSNIALYDYFDITVGPFIINTVTNPSSTGIKVVITQNSVTAIYPQEVSIPANILIPVSFPITYSSNGAYDIAIQVQAISTSPTDVIIKSPGDPWYGSSQQNGLSGNFNWLKVNHYRNF